MRTAGKTKKKASAKKTAAKPKKPPAKTAKKPPAKPKQPAVAAEHPFLFYGVSPDDWGEGANCGHAYVLAFRDEPSAAAQKAAQRAFEKACGALVDTSCGPWTWQGKHALVTVGEQRTFDEDEEFMHGDFFAGVRRALVAAHGAAPLAEVVYLNARGPSEVPWEDWTLATQPRPSAWPDFGHVALYFTA